LTFPREPQTPNPACLDRFSSGGRGLCVAVIGVFNWRSHRAPLGDWEYVPLKGQVTICYDSDA
jgi:hypothetical protein